MKTMIELAFSGARILHRAGLAEFPLIRLLRKKTKHTLFQRSSDLSTPFVQLPLEGSNLLIPYHLSRHYIRKEFEPKTTTFMKNHIRPGMTIVDVGANIGYFTLLMAQLTKPNGFVYALEPTPLNLEFLRKNVTNNNLSNTQILPYAAGSQSRVRKFYARKSSNVSSFFGTDTLADTAIEVQEISLDNIFEQSVDFVKIDVEGAEIEVLRGMKHILTNNPDICLVIEWNPRALHNAGYEAEALPIILQESGFSLSMPGDKRTVNEICRLLRTQNMPEGWYTNLFAKRIS